MSFYVEAAATQASEAIGTCIPGAGAVAVIAGCCEPVFARLIGRAYRRVPTRRADPAGADW